MSVVLIDTDVAIDFLRGIPYARSLLAGLWVDGQAALSVLTVYELTAEMRDSEKGSTLNFIEACVIEQVTVEIAHKGGELYRRYRAKVNCLSPKTQSNQAPVAYIPCCAAQFTAWRHDRTELDTGSRLCQ